jgi:hypothetical protein
MSFILTSRYKPLIQKEILLTRFAATNLEQAAACQPIDCLPNTWQSTETRNRFRCVAVKEG